MCTVTIITTQDGFRLVTNRDERRTRPRAIAPAQGSFGDRAAVSPTDPLGGGTWVAATDAGLVYTVLNGNPSPMPALPPKESLVSRGLIIPRIACASTIAEAINLTENLPLERLAPFRLVATDGRTIVEAWWARETLSLSRRGAAPSCWASSGLGDALVQVRLPLFREMVVDAGATPQAQDAFHRHQWPDNTRLSVRMDREDARTVSRTTVEVSTRTRETLVRYEDDLGERTLSLPLHDREHASHRAARGNA